MRWAQGGFPSRWRGWRSCCKTSACACACPGGACPTAPCWAAVLPQLDPGEENSLQRAWALAGEALLGCPGVRVAQVEYHSGTGLWQVWVETPLGAGQVAVPGKEETDG